MKKVILTTGAIMGLLAVILGAFGAHGLKTLVNPEQVVSFTTGVRYQMFHAILLLLVGNMSFLPEPSQKKLYYIFVGGITLFSGSIYLLVIDQIFLIDLSSIGFITPLGGLVLIIGWIFLIFSIRKIK